MSRQTQDFFTWLLGVGILISQATPWVPEKPFIIAAAGGLLGLPTIRKVQDAVNKATNGSGNGGGKIGEV